MDRSRILLGDAHELIVEGLKRVLDPHYEVVGAAVSPQSLLAAARAHNPDLIALDLGMIGIGERDYEVLRLIRVELPQTKLVGLIAGPYSSPRNLGNLVTVYIAKTSPKEEILAAIAAALAAPENCSAFIPRAQPFSGLTSRQWAILQMIADGKSSKEMAFALNISVKTVEFHRANLRSQLGVRSTAELTKRALQAGY